LTAAEQEAGAGLDRSQVRTGVARVALVPPQEGVARDPAQEAATPAQEERGATAGAEQEALTDPAQEAEAGADTLPRTPVTVDLTGLFSWRKVIGAATACAVALMIGQVPFAHSCAWVTEAKEEKSSTRATGSSGKRIVSFLISLNRPLIL
jgi:hypothetical protein